MPEQWRDTTPVASTARQPLLRSLTNSAIGAGVFFLTCIGLHNVLPFPEVRTVSDKLRFFAAHKDEFDTLFIGSSRVYFQISPEIFDGLMREGGRPTHSFNFGIGAMNLPESAYVLEQILNTKPRHLKWVFIELGELQTTWAPEFKRTRRALYWHDWKRTSLVLRKILDAGTDSMWSPNPRRLRDLLFDSQEKANRREEFVFHAAQFQKNAANVARATDLFDYFSRRDTDKQVAMYVGEQGDGYIPKSGELSASQTKAYERALAKLKAETRGSVISRYTIEACRQTAQEIRAIGAVPVFVVPPTAKPFQVRARDDLQFPGTVMAFNDPRTYPNFYRNSVRRDPEHMTTEGAEEFTRLLATSFMQRVKSGEIK